MTEEQERAAFEAWVGPPVRLPEWSPMTCAWLAWQARAALSPSTPDTLPSDLDEAIKLSKKEMR